MVQSLATNLALFFGQYVNPIGIDHAGWKFYFLYEGFLLIQVSLNHPEPPYSWLTKLKLVTVIFFFIETRGATLEEISRTFDGEDAVEEVKVRALVGEKAELTEQVENVNRNETKATQ